MNHYRDQDMRLRVVKGVHALHIYATEYWTEYVLAHAASEGSPTRAPLIDLACKLSDQLDTIVGLEYKLHNEKIDGLDRRLVALQPFPRLRQHIERFLRARSFAQLEAELLCSNGKYSPWIVERESKLLSPSDSEAPLAARPPARDGVSAILHKYQEVVKAILDEDECPGVSAEEFKQFRSQLGASAFTCRLKSCPRATLGFSSASLCQEHEIAHVRHYRCTYEDCKYPPFPSARSLKDHLKKHHQNNIRRPAIRRNLSGPATLHDGSQAKRDLAIKSSDFARPPGRDYDFEPLPGTPSAAAAAAAGEAQPAEGPFVTIPKLTRGYPIFSNQQKQMSLEAAAARTATATTADAGATKTQANGVATVIPAPAVGAARTMEEEKKQQAASHWHLSTSPHRIHGHAIPHPHPMFGWRTAGPADTADTRPPSRSQ